MFMVFIVCSYIYKIKSSTMSIKFWAYFFLVLGISATHISGEGVVTTELLCDGDPAILIDGGDLLIHVQSSFYGRATDDICNSTPSPTPPGAEVILPCSSPSAPVLINNICHLGRACILVADNGIFGAPCNGTTEYLMITYVLLPPTQTLPTTSASPTTMPITSAPPTTMSTTSAPPTTISTTSAPPTTMSTTSATPITTVEKLSIDICEGEWEPRLNCPDGQTISICSSIYGRSDTTTCPDTSATTSNVDCMSLNPLYVRTTCQGRQSCIVFAGDRNLGGDPCPDTHKYLHIDYRCVAE
ncbi:rhamnose-binding lectin [Strongylocentrotus purpuratus]|uniref:SUEL-type lectin domain-containing protein n=1 Tax=Strongylocentrotus purpuratus TaxID=7668 RepID=A0A7M7NBH4_STRPU|nr:rhamnose-binding lectin [Strongylocentrotus purpuratus]